MNSLGDLDEELFGKAHEVRHGVDIGVAAGGDLGIVDEVVRCWRGCC